MHTFSSDSTAAARLETVSFIQVDLNQTLLLPSLAASCIANFDC